MAEAKLNREYAFRMLGVGALMFGMCVWSIYDGGTGWPNKNRALERVRPALLATNLTAEAWLERGDDGVSPLQAVFAREGSEMPSKLAKKVGELRLPEKDSAKVELYAEQARQVQKVFGEPVYNGHELQTQFVQAGITFLFGVWAWALVALKARRRFCADADGLSGSGFGGGRVAYADIARIDWSKWDDKGIVALTLKSGRRRVLDGWHFSGMTGIVDEIKRQRPDLAEKKV